jgi:hypothetical protein
VIAELVGVEPEAVADEALRSENAPVGLPVTEPEDAVE